MTSTIKADVVTAQTTNGDVTLQGNGTGTVAIGDNTAITGTATVSSTLGVTGETTLTGATTISGQAMPTSGGLWQGRNLWINGAFTISQRATSASSITSAGFHTVDRLYFNYGTLGTWTLSQSTDVPSGKGFGYSFKADCTAADASPAVGDRLLVAQSIEGQNLQRLKKGTSDAEDITISFWVKSGKTGVHIVEIYDNDNGRSINKSYTIASADTWENHSITFAGDTTGALTNDNNTSLTIGFWLGAGTNFTSGALATSWATASNINRAVGQVNLADSIANNWLITGIMVEAGTQTPFEHESPAETLRKCHRYYVEERFSSGTRYGGAAFAGVAWSTGEAAGTCSFPTPMRATPTVTTVNSAGTVASIHVAAAGDVVGGVTIPLGISEKGFSSVGKSASWSVGNICIGGYRADAEL